MVGSSKSEGSILLFRTQLVIIWTTLSFSLPEIRDLGIGIPAIFVRAVKVGVSGSRRFLGSFSRIQPIACSIKRFFCFFESFPWISGRPARSLNAFEVGSSTDEESKVLLLSHVRASSAALALLFSSMRPFLTSIGIPGSDANAVKVPTSTSSKSTSLSRSQLRASSAAFPISLAS